MLSFDEINRLAKQNEPRSMDIDRFFDEMFLQEQEKEDRKEFARLFEQQLFMAMALLFMYLQIGSKDGIQQVKDVVEESFLSTMRLFIVPDSELTLYAQRYADEFVEATVRNQGTTITADNPDDVKGEYFFSEDRAKYNAENEANTIFNYEQLREAIEDGYAYKQWVAMRDERVRKTHSEVDGTIIPINDLFQVGRARMRFPHDEMAEAYPEELVNCRCSMITYTRDELNDIARGL